MHSKLDILRILKQFFAMVRNQFSKDVKVICTDDAYDFFKSECSSFFSSLGVIHQSSCPYTPQQNGVVERKHRHILDIARSLRFQASLPLNFGGIVCYQQSTSLIVLLVPLFETKLLSKYCFASLLLTLTFESSVAFVMQKS